MGHPFPPILHTAMSVQSPPPPVEIEILHDLNSVDAADWNRLVSPDDPFTEHAFLASIENSGSVGREAGWVPVHLLAKQDGVLVGAAPLYLKNHSYGEYIFDWGWANAARGAGIPYYPKLVSAVPFTPATGRRLLTQDVNIEKALIDGMHGVAEATRAQSIHVLFCTPEEHQVLSERSEFIGRMTHQFHWDNEGYTDFDGWLSRFRSRRRKEVRRERKVAKERGAQIRMVRGEALTPELWVTLRQFYDDTTERKHAEPYLKPQFFLDGAETLGHSAVAFIAEHDGDVVAGALCFQRGKHLYGRYWGCLPEWGALHFELCYHAPIEACIEHGWTHFEAGAQGMHKMQRGLVPVRTWSAHHLRHPGLHDAVQRATTEERTHIAAEIEWLTEKGPFHRNQDQVG
jgi:hypothetical protein